MPVRLLLFFYILFFVCSGFTQETQPGDSCTAGEAGRYILSGGPELSNVGYLIICDGTNWNKVMGFGTNGVMQLQLVNTSSCSNSDGITYDSATGGLRCGPSDTIAPIWITAAGTLATVAPETSLSLTVSASDESSTVSYQKVSGASFINISTGGTVSGIAPVTNGTYAFSVRATDNAGNTSDRAFNVVVSGAGGPASCPNLGDVCSDGTVYAGKSPDTDTNMYVTQQDAPGGAIYTFNDGSTSNYINTALVDCTNSESTCRTGKANTDLLVTLDSSSAAGVQQHMSAQYCFDLVENTYTDWYLPSIAEMDVIYKNLINPTDTNNPGYADGLVSGEAGGTGTNNGPQAATFLQNKYWSSSERSFDDAWRIEKDPRGTLIGNGSQKHVLRGIRCARKD